MELYTMHMVTILPIPILRITIVREPQLSAGFAGKSRNRGTLKVCVVICLPTAQLQKLISGGSNLCVCACDRNAVTA